MKSVKEDVYASLQGYAPLAALVGDRIYHTNPPEDITLPCVFYKQVSGGADNADNVPYIQRARIQVDVCARPDTDDIDAISDAVVSGMGSVKGNVSLVNEVDMFNHTLLCPDHIMDFMVIAKI